MNDEPGFVCPSCEVRFWIQWQRDGFTDRIEYCPFCGVEIKESDLDAQTQ